VVRVASPGAQTSSSALALLGSFNSAYSFMSNSTGSMSDSITRAGSMVAGANREVCLGVLLKKLPVSAAEYLECCVDRMTDTRRANAISGGSGGDTPGEVAAGDDPDGDRLETASALSINTAEEKVPVSAVPMETQPSSQESATGAKKLLRSKIGFANLASDVLSDVFKDIMQDILTEKAAL
jgi:hypothetical protein